MKNTVQEDVANRILRNPTFLKDVDDLAKEYLSRLINGCAEKYYLEIDQVKRLLESSMLMSLSSDYNHKRTSFEIATMMFENKFNDMDNMVGILRLVCARIGNIPSMNLFRNTLYEMPLDLDIESEISIERNSMNIGGNAIYLTDFQSDVLNVLGSGDSVSISAPTSAGKSYIINNYIYKKFLESNECNIVLIVPTRALIRQSVVDIKRYIENVEQTIDIVTSSVEEVNENRADRRLFILTQERLQSILYNWQSPPSFDILIVDESQKISDNNRGVILEDTINEIVNSKPAIQSIFISPLSSNPGFMFNISNITNHNTEVYTSLSPVVQNVYTISLKGGKNINMVFKRVYEKSLRQLFNISIDEKLPRTKVEVLAFVARFVGDGDNNIIYANSPSEAEKIAIVLKDLINELVVMVDEIEETIEILKKMVHREYYLIECLAKGVGYHYSAMPDIAKIAVEELFRREYISYIVCTSTLLEGVNLPAKNIFLKNPLLGKAPMNDSSFWNLAGRAGRLMKDLVGNVFCIDEDTWSKPVILRDKGYNIESSLTNIIKDDKFIKYCEDIGNSGFDGSDQASNSLILKVLSKGERDCYNFLRRRLDHDYTERILDKIKDIIKDISIPSDVLKKNKNIDFRTQQRLLRYFQSLGDEEISSYAPRNPSYSDFYENLKSILRLSDEYLSSKIRGRKYVYFTLLIDKWIKERNFNEIIESKIRYERNSGNINVDVNKMIRDVMGEINDDIRFYYFKVVKCFCDLLVFELDRRSINRDDIPYCDFGLPNYIELGMYNKGVIQLHNFGLSRTTAIEVSKYCMNNGIKQEDQLNWVRENFKAISQNFPRVFRSEMSKIFF